MTDVATPGRPRLSIPADREATWVLDVAANARRVHAGKPPDHLETSASRPMLLPAVGGDSASAFDMSALPRVVRARQRSARWVRGTFVCVTAGVFAACARLGPKDSVVAALLAAAAPLVGASAAGIMLAMHHGVLTDFYDRHSRKVHLDRQ